MDFEKIDKFRQQQADDKNRTEEMDAIKNVSNSVDKSTATTTATLKNVTKDIAKSSDIDKVIRELKETQLANYLSAGQKSQIILADSTDLGQAVSALGNKLDALIESNGTEKSDKELIATVKSELAKVVEAFNKDTDQEVISAIRELKAELGNIEVNPVVNIPEPVINVDIPKTDFSKLSTDIKAVTTAVKAIKPAQLDLSPLIESTNKVSESVNGLTFPVANFVQDPYIQYKAVDEYDDGVSTTVKYYGFIEPRGNWYILQVDPSASEKTYRYAFGDSDYETAWADRASLTYGYPFGK